MKTQTRLWRSVLGVLVIFSVVAGTVWAADVEIDSFTDGGYNLSRDTVGTSTYLASGLSSAIGGYRMMILEVTVATSGAYSQWTVNASNSFISLSIPSGDQGQASLQWDGNDNSTAIECVTGLGGQDLVDSGNTGIVVRIIASDTVNKNLTVRVYTDCGNWRTITRAIPPVADNTIVDIPLLFTDFGGGAGTMNWASVNAIELEVDGTLASGADATVKFIKATGDSYEYGDLPLVGTPGLPSGQTGYSTNILNARHVPQGMRLGGSVDTEANYRDSILADGDNTNDVDDEDGVERWQPTSWSADSTQSVAVRYRGCGDPFNGDDPCYINGWIDWNRDGNFDGTDENILQDVYKDADGYTISGFSFPIPAGTSFTDVRYYARFRICPAANTCNDPDADQTNVTDGEIEDYAWDWGNPTAVDLVSFAASSTGSAIQLTWETASELDNLGFHVYRSEATDADGPWTQLNDSLIPSQAPGSPVGATYEFSDQAVEAGITYYYQLESVDATGAATSHGVVSASLPSAEPETIYRVYLPFVGH